MKDLHLYNLEVLDKLIKLNRDDLSNPLLISPQIGNRKIMYIGKETNGWYDEEYQTVDSIEEKYADFLLNRTNGRPFWKFIKTLTSVENVLWCNALLVGRRHVMGTPSVNEEIKTLSSSYLKFAYDLFQPETVIIACGHDYPYYDIITDFVNHIGWQPEGSLSKDNPVLSNNDNLFWTYHPKYLSHSKNTNKVLEKIRTTKK